MLDRVSAAAENLGRNAVSKEIADKPEVMPKLTRPHCGRGGNVTDMTVCRHIFTSPVIYT